MLSVGQVCCFDVALCVTIYTVVHCHDTAYTSVNIWSAPTVHCVRLLFIVIIVNERCTSSTVPAHSHCNGTANCAVGHHCDASLLLGQNAFNANSVEKATFSISRATQNTD